jgi:hypothetical protein
MLVSGDGLIEWFFGREAAEVERRPPSILVLNLFVSSLDSVVERDALYQVCGKVVVMPGQCCVFSFPGFPCLLGFVFRWLVIEVLLRISVYSSVLHLSRPTLKYSDSASS